MKLLKEYNGYVFAKICKVYNSYNMNKLLCQLDKTKPIKIHVIVSDNINIGGWNYTYMSNDDISIKTVYIDDIDLYESMDDNDNDDYVYMIKILSICK